MTLDQLKQVVRESRPEEPSVITITMDGDSQWVYTEGKSTAQLAQEVVQAGEQLVTDLAQSW